MDIFLRYGEPLNTVSANILVVDDVADNLEILKDLLSFHGHHVLTAANGKDALQSAQDARPDLILLDIIMPGMDGYEVCTHLKANEATKDIPVIFVSSLADVQNAVKGFQVGGVDYVIKPFQSAEILARITTHLTTLRLRKQLEEQNIELEHLASTDSLTGLTNRRHFFKIAETEFDVAVRDGIPVSVSLFDIDHYKIVNDTYGHLVGDRVLEYLARLIFSQTRESDVTARYGGDEFVVLHPSTDRQDAYQIAENIRKKVDACPYLDNERNIHVTISGGIVDTQVIKNVTRFDEVLAKADQALYSAKRAGRNQVVVFQE